ncbi:hypothetical protein GLV99_13120 [Virgibacillus massiliensis]|nr:hypothetical protein [Virgibacillus massiliensis]
MLHGQCFPFLEVITTIKKQ